MGRLHQGLHGTEDPALSQNVRGGHGEERHHTQPHQLTDELVVHAAEGHGGGDAKAERQPVAGRTPPQGGKGIQAWDVIKARDLGCAFARLGHDGADERGLRQRLPHPALRVGIADHDRALAVEHRQGRAAGEVRRGQLALLPGFIEHQPQRGDNGDEDR